MKSDIINIIENAFETLATDESSCLVEIFDYIEREVVLLNDNFVVREPYHKDGGRFVEIELSEDAYIYCNHKWQRGELSLWWVEDCH